MHQNCFLLYRRPVDVFILKAVLWSCIGKNPYLFNTCQFSLHQTRQNYRSKLTSSFVVKRNYVEMENKSTHFYLCINLLKGDLRLLQFWDFFFLISVQEHCWVLSEEMCKIHSGWPVNAVLGDAGLCSHLPWLIEKLLWLC